MAARRTKKRRVPALKRYVGKHVHGRCGQAVTRLAEAGLPVLQFGELHMWGRYASGGALEDDEELVAAVHPLRP